jgi:hypothetical protein
MMNKEDELMERVAERAKAFQPTYEDKTELRKLVAAYISPKQEESIEKNSTDLEIGESAHSVEEWEELLKNSEGLRKLIAARLYEDRKEQEGWKFL